MTKKYLFSAILFFSILGTCYSQEDSRFNSIKNQLEVLKINVAGLEETININITQTTLSNFLLAISKVHGININVSPDLNSINIVNNFSNVSVENILLFLVKEYNLDIEFIGNILSVKRFIPVPKPEKEKEILAYFSPETGNLSLDLKNDRLDKVFRKIMDISGKNLLYTPEIESQPLSIYINDVPFDIALKKLAESNNLIQTKSRDGFFIFENMLSTPTPSNIESASSRPVRSRRTNFYYKIEDTLQKRVTVDFQNTPIADVIYAIGEDLKIDIFTASPLNDAGVATVKAENINFDLLLNYLFESAVQSSRTGNENTSSAGGGSKFTYKKEGNKYYFGTENQLSLKQFELVTMNFRSVQMLSNPAGNGQRRQNRNNFAQGTTNFYSSSSFDQNQNIRGGSTPFNTPNMQTGENTQISSIQSILPEDIKAGLDIKIDPELNSFIVSGPGINVERFKNFIASIDKPVPVILIEVMILEVNRSAIIETGVSFGLGKEPSQTVGSVFPSTDIRIGADKVNRIIGNFSGFGSLNLGSVLPEFYLDIKAMESNGFIRVLSTPKLSTLNGHKAYLSSGQTTYYAVTSQSFFGSQIPQTSEIRNYVPIDAELAIEILPFVSGDGEITLDIRVIQSAFTGERIDEDAPPGMNSREFSSIIRMRNQDVAILGGIEEVRKDDSGSGVPLLARVPLIKWLFSKKRREDSKRTLNILIKPTVIY